MNTWEKFEGWFDPADVRVYQNLALSVKNAPVVEVGSWKGRSAASIAEICRSNGCVLYCVDTWLGSKEHAHLGDSLKTVLAEFTGGMDAAGFLGSPVVPIQMTSVDAAAQMRRLGIRPRLVFIDAAHDYENVREDVIAWGSVIHPDGVIAGHDYNPGWSGVIRAVAELAPKAVINPWGSAMWHCLAKELTLP